jgi:hypothetical protein
MYRCWKFHFPVSSITMNTFLFLKDGSVTLLVVSQPTYYWTVGWVQNYKRHGNKQSWSKWDILLAFGCMDRGKLQKASVMIARKCGIMVKMCVIMIKMCGITVKMCGIVVRMCYHGHNVWYHGQNVWYHGQNVCYHGQNVVSWSKYRTDTSEYKWKVLLCKMWHRVVQ